MILSQVANLGEMFKIESEELVTKTKLQDIVDEQSFIVFQPTVHGIPLRANKTTPLRFSFCRNNGMYVFDAVMEKSFVRDNLRVCQFKAISEVEKTQRRSSFRLPVVLDAIVSLIQPEVDIPGTHAVYEAKTSDLSDAGMQFTCYEYFIGGTLINIVLDLGGENELSLNAKVIRCFLPSKKTVKYNVSVKFVNLSSGDQAKLSRFILKTQIKNRNRLR